MLSWVVPGLEEPVGDVEVLCTPGVALMGVRDFRDNLGWEVLGGRSYLAETSRC